MLTRAARQREPTATRTSDEAAPWPPSGWTMSVAVAWRLSSWTVRHSHWALTTVDIMKTPACPVALAKVGPVVQSRPAVFLFGAVQRGLVPWLPCSQRALILVQTRGKFRYDCRHGVTVHCVFKCSAFVPQGDQCFQHVCSQAWLADM